MRNKTSFILVVFTTTVLLPAAVSLAIDSKVPIREMGAAFVGQDLHLSGRGLISYQLSSGVHVLVFQDAFGPPFCKKTAKQGPFSMSIGADEFFSDSAVVWLEPVLPQGQLHGYVHIDYKGWAYLQGNVSVKKGKSAKTTNLSQMVVGPPFCDKSQNGNPEEDLSMVVGFGMSGEVFVTVEKREIADPRRLELYAKALATVACYEPKLQPELEALVPDVPNRDEVRLGTPELPTEGVRAERPPYSMLDTRYPILDTRYSIKTRIENQESRIKYPVNWAPVGAVAPKVEWDEPRPSEGRDEVTKVGTVIGRLYVWQKLDERGGLLELQADNAVMFSSLVARDSSPARAVTGHGARAITAIYLSGDVVMTEGQRTIRADEIYYDFESKKAIAVNAVMRSFDSERGIPIYVRAAKLMQLAENKFSAEDITLTSSEFYQPQISLTASTVFITDTTTVDEQLKRVSDSSFDAQMHDVRLKVDDKTIFYWPFIRSNLQRPDVPLKGVHLGYDEIWGMSVETRWYLARLLGLREPEDTDSTFTLDYYSERGFGTGANVDYAKEDYFGKLLGYVISDSGQDRLGRHSSRRDLEPDRELRGRFGLQHRHFLPYNWQLTAETSYASDERFIESFYRNEFNVGKEQETLVHFKRLEENWALSLLGKGRINDFADKLEELPGAQFHLTGQSLFNDMFTLYSDTEVSRLRQRIGDKHSTMIDEKQFSFVSHRTELDMPIQIRSQKSEVRSQKSESVFCPMKVVPFVAGTFGYDDRSGFRRSLVDGSNKGSFGADKVWIGEAGVRVGTQYWKEYRHVRSRLWDLDQLRHIIKPQLTAVLYDESDSVVKQHDTLNIGISQRLQTKRRRSSLVARRASPESRVTSHETVDWMRLDTDFTWVSDSEDAGASGPDRFIWNRPGVPLRVLSAPDIFNGDLTDTSLHRFERFGPRRNYFGVDYIWRMSDTGVLLSDMNFDMQSGVVQQFNVGFSGLRWPNLSYYIGSRYLKRVEVLDEKGSNVFTFAFSYILDPRYTLAYSGQFDFDYGANVGSDITLIRRYHRVYCSLTFSVDESLDRQAIIFSIWPQGVPELVIGPRRYMGN